MWFQSLYTKVETEHILFTRNYLRFVWFHNIHISCQGNSLMKYQSRVSQMIITQWKLIVEIINVVIKVLNKL